MGPRKLALSGPLDFATRAVRHPRPGTHAPVPTPHILDDSLRIRFLSETLIRVEERGAEGFEDRATFHVVNRSWPAVGVRARRRNGASASVSTVSPPRPPKRW